MDLTGSQAQKKWYNKYRWLIIIVGLAFALLTVMSIIVLLGKYKALANDSESGLPAIKVYIANGCGVDRLAADYARSIERLNIEVVGFGDTRLPIYDKSVIVVRNSDLHDLKRLQNMTGIRRYTIARDKSFKAEFEIILGKDFDQFLDN